MIIWIVSRIILAIAYISMSWTISVMGIMLNVGDHLNDRDYLNDGGALNSGFISMVGRDHLNDRDHLNV